MYSAPLFLQFPFTIPFAIRIFNFICNAHFQPNLLLPIRNSHFQLHLQCPFPTLFTTSYLQLRFQLPLQSPFTTPYSQAPIPTPFTTPYSQFAFATSFTIPFAIYLYNSPLQYYLQSAFFVELLDLAYLLHTKRDQLSPVSLVVMIIVRPPLPRCLVHRLVEHSRLRTLRLRVAQW